jgi:hypothetical protein
MGTVRRIGAAIRKRRFLIRFWVIFAGILGFVSTILTILGRHMSALEGLALAILSFSVATIVSRKQLYEAQLSVDDVLPDEIDSIQRIYLECPCSSERAHHASLLAEECYDTQFTIAPSTFEAIRVRNPHILAALVDQQGAFLGYFDVIPLKDAFAQLFIEGRVTEDQLRHEDVLGAAESFRARYLFISGLAVWHPESFAGRRNASMLVWSLLRYLDHYFSDSQALVFALAATKEGDDILRRFRLKLTTDGNTRPDHYRLYSVQLDNFEIARRLACLPDWSGLCMLPWNDMSLPSRSARPTLPRSRHHRLGPVA